MKLSETLGEIQQRLRADTVSVDEALDDVIQAFRDDIARRDREEREAAERSVGG